MSAPIYRVDVPCRLASGQERSTHGNDTKSPFGWILVAARWPDRIREWMPAKLAELENPQLVRLYRVLSEIFDSDTGDDDPRLAEVADIMAAMAEQAYAAGEINLDEMTQDDLPFDLLDNFAVETDPRAQRLLDLMRERGWSGWIRMERLAPPPD
jgi:hypothetical protein